MQIDNADFYHFHNNPCYANVYLFCIVWADLANHRARKTIKPCSPASAYHIYSLCYCPGRNCQTALMIQGKKKLRVSTDCCTQYHILFFFLGGGGQETQPCKHPKLPVSESIHLCQYHDRLLRLATALQGLRLRLFHITTHLRTFCWSCQGLNLRTGISN